MIFNANSGRWICFKFYLGDCHIRLAVQPTSQVSRAKELTALHIWCQASGKVFLSDLQIGKKNKCNLLDKLL